MNSEQKNSQIEKEMTNLRTTINEMKRSAEEKEEELEQKNF